MLNEADFSVNENVYKLEQVFINVDDEMAFKLLAASLSDNEEYKLEFLKKVKRIRNSREDSFS